MCDSIRVAADVKQHAHKVYILILHGGTEYSSSAVIHYCSFKYWLQVAHDYTVFSGFEGRGWRLTEAFTKTPSYMWPSGSSVCACCELSRCFWKSLVKHWAARNGEEDMSPGRPCFHGNKRYFQNHVNLLRLCLCVLAVLGDIKEVQRNLLLLI